MRWTEKVSGRIGVRARTTMVALGALAFALAAAGILMVVLLGRQLDASVTDSVLTTARQVAGQVGSDGVNDPDLVTVMGSRDSAITQVIDATGRVVASSPEAAGRPALTTARPRTGSEQVLTVHSGLPDQDGELRLAAVGVNGPDGNYTVISARSTELASEPTERLALLVTISFLVLFAVSALAVHRAVGAALRPVDRMRATVADLSARDLSSRVGLPPGRDEVHRLATTLNGLLDRLASAQAAQRRFVSDASHELRSPLSTITTALEVAQHHPGAIATAELLPLVHRETARLRGLVDDLLLLARTDDTTDRPRLSEVDLDDIVYGEAQRLRASTTLRVEVRATPVKVIGDEAQLRRAVRNLADNARDHAATRVRLSSGVHEGHGLVEVGDDGPGVAEPDRERVFERFVRADAARDRAHGGAGLGLSIVAGIAARHGGRARCSAGRGEYPGALMTLEIPVGERHREVR